MQLTANHVYLGIYHSIEGRPKIPQEVFVTVFHKDKFKDLWSSTEEEHEWDPNVPACIKNDYQIVEDLGDLKTAKYQETYIRNNYPEYFV